MADEASLSVGVPRETFPGERRVALTPNALPALTKVGLRIIVESGAGAEAGFLDEAYRHHGAEIGSRSDAFDHTEPQMPEPPPRPSRFRRRRGTGCPGGCGSGRC